MKRGFLFFIASFFAISELYSQKTTELEPGDIAIVAVSSIAPKSFDFVCLVPVAAGTEVCFTDDAWVDSLNSFRGSEGTLKYTFADNVDAGTVIHWEKDAPGYTSAGSFNLSTSGDNIVCYQKSEPLTFVYGVGWAKNTKGNWEYLSSTSGASSTSDIPTGLSIAASTISYLGGADSYAYSDAANHTGMKSDILQDIATATNYISSDVSAQSVAVHFTVAKEGDNDKPDTDQPSEPAPTEVIGGVDEDNMTPQSMGACQFLYEYTHTAELYSDYQRTQLFDFDQWNEQDTILYMKDLKKILLKHEVKELTVTVENKVITAPGDNSVMWYKDNEFIANAESYAIDAPGQYYAMAKECSGCYLKSQEIMVLSTDRKLMSENHEPVIYVDFQGRMHAERPIVPHFEMVKDTGLVILAK